MRKASQVSAEKNYAERQREIGRKPRKFWLTDSEADRLRGLLDELRNEGIPQQHSEPEPRPHIADQPITVRGQTWSPEQREKIREAQGQHPDRAYLLVPKNERNEAKQYGARFDGSVMCWYWQGMVDTELTHRWPHV